MTPRTWCATHWYSALWKLMTSLMRLGRRIDRMGTNLDIDVACTGVWLPPATDLQRWCDAAVQAGAPDKTDTEISLRITDAAEIQNLNARYRQQRSEERRVGKECESR